MRVGGFGVIHETDGATVGRFGDGDGLDAVAARRELLERGQRLVFVCSETQHQRQRGQGVGEQMRVDRAIRARSDA